MTHSSRAPSSLSASPPCDEQCMVEALCWVSWNVRKLQNCWLVGLLWTKTWHTRFMLKLMSLFTRQVHWFFPNLFWAEDSGFRWFFFYWFGHVRLDIIIIFSILSSLLWFDRTGIRPDPEMWLSKPFLILFSTCYQILKKVLKI